MCDSTSDTTLYLGRIPIGSVLTDLAPAGSRAWRAGVIDNVPIVWTLRLGSRAVGCPPKQRLATLLSLDDGATQPVAEQAR